MVSSDRGGIISRFVSVIMEIGKVIIENSKFECTEIKADKVLIAVGFTPNNELFAQLEGKVPHIITLGDCKAIGKLFEAIHDGFNAGCLL